MFFRGAQIVKPQNSVVPYQQRSMSSVTIETSIGMVIAYNQNCFIVICTNHGKSQNNSKELGFSHLICKALDFLLLQFRQRLLTKLKAPSSQHQTRSFYSFNIYLSKDSLSLRLHLNNMTHRHTNQYCHSAHQLGCKIPPLSLV